MIRSLCAHFELCCAPTPWSPSRFCARGVPLQLHGSGAARSRSRPLTQRGSRLLMHLPRRPAGLHSQNTESKLTLLRVSRRGTEEHETKPGARLSEGSRRRHRLRTQKLMLLVEPQDRLHDGGECAGLLVLPSAFAPRMSSRR